MQSEGQRSIISVCGEDDHTGFVLGCRTSATLANPHRRDTCFCTLASAPLHYNCSALTMFVSNVKVTQSHGLQLQHWRVYSQRTQGPQLQYESDIRLHRSPFTSHLTPQRSATGFKGSTTLKPDHHAVVLGTKAAG